MDQKYTIHPKMVTQYQMDEVSQYWQTRKIIQMEQCLNLNVSDLVRDPIIFVMEHQ